MNRSNMFGHYEEAPLARMTAAAPATQDPAAQPAAPASAPTSSGANAPVAIGQYWPGMGGIYAGLSLTDDGLHACHLILADTDKMLELSHKDAGAWAAGLDIDGHKDFTLPNRIDGVVLYQRLRDQFSHDEWHWLSETHASYSDVAWFQFFSYGYQSNDRKTSRLRARAVRRLVI